MKKGDWIIIIAVLLFASIISYSMSITKAEKIIELQIYQNGKMIHQLAIDHEFNKTITIKNDEHFNNITIEGGKIFMSDANCTDKLCVHSKPISKNGEMIVCLPHELYIKIVGAGNSSEFDAMVS